MPRVKINDAEIYYETIGEGFPLVLLHPWPTDHAMWMFQTPVFSERFRVITPDSRGLGRSDKSKTGYRLKKLSDDVYDLIRHLGIERAFVVGNSLGGAVAQKFSIDHPEVVQATIWIGAPTFPLNELLAELEPGKSVPAITAYLADLKNHGYLHFWNNIWKPTMHYQFHESFANSPLGAYLIRYLFEDRYAKLNANPEGVIGILEDLCLEESLDAELGKLEIPAAIVTGSGDDTRPYCEQQHKAVPRTQLFVVQNSGHFCYMDQPAKFNEFMLHFLEKNGL